MVYNRLKKLYTGTIAVTNPTTSVIAGPVKAELSGLPAGVTLANASGTHDGVPFVRVSTSLGAGATVTVPVSFSNPNNLFISYTEKTYAGGI